MNRKDDHIKASLNQPFKDNDFDHVRFVPDTLCYTDIKDVDIKVSYFGFTFDAPIYINAMSGGSEQSMIINEKLAQIALACNIPIATGSVSAAIKDQKWEESFHIMRKTYPKGCIMANVGLSQTEVGAQKAIDILKANVLQVHLNAAQEITMPEGDREFSFWPERLKAIITSSKVPVIVKEVGFGMSRQSLETLSSLGAKYIDISGKGGTNFIQVENERREDKLDYFESHGFSTVESLLEARGIQGVHIFASGGVRNPYDVVKALALGANMVGLSGYFLKLVTTYPIETCIAKTKAFIETIKMLMAVLNIDRIEKLQSLDLIYSEKLLSFMKQRQIQ
jgi:isopentenyl-diphosphate delta-isomerase